jgi:hypothetical protein
MKAPYDTETKSYSRIRRMHLSLRVLEETTRHKGDDDVKDDVANEDALDEESALNVDEKWEIYSQGLATCRRRR